MKYTNLILFTCVFTLLSCQSKSTKNDPGMDLTKFPETGLIEQQIPVFETNDLKNQAQILWMKDDKLPSLSIKIMIKGGFKEDAKSKSGAMVMMGRLLDKGAENQTAEQIAEFFESQGAQFRIQVADDYTLVSLDALSTNQDQVIPAFVKVVFEPTFPDSEFQREKVKAADEISRMPDEPQGFVDVAFQKYLYVGTPYGRMMDDLGSLTKKDIVQAYKKAFVGANIRAGVVGQWTPESRKLIEEAIAKLPESNIPMAKPIEFPAIKGHKIRLVVKDDLKQSQVRIGGLGVARKDNDFLALTLATSALGAGGSFASRLIQEIRVKRGLTYGISGSLDPHLDTGSYEISTFTRHEKIHEIIEQTLIQLNDFVEKGMTAEELASNRSYLAGTIARQTETTADVMNRLLMMRVYEVPDSYLIDFNKNLRGLELNPVNAIVKKKIPDQNLKILVYGPRKEGLEQLRKFGPVEVVDYKDVIKAPKLKAQAEKEPEPETQTEIKN